MTLKLRDYQEEAMKKIINVPYSLICVKAGKGKTLSSIFASRYMFKHHMIDKAVFSGTKTSITSFVREFNKLGVSVKVIEKAEDFVEFICSDKKICVCKHHMFELIGKNQNFLTTIEKHITNNKVRIFLTIDEAHNLSSASGVGTMRSSCGVGHACFERCRFMFTRVTLMTATPYSSCLSQFYGLIHLIYPLLWKKSKDFWDDYIELKELRDWKTGKFLRYEKVSYKNLKKLRSLVEPFTYFYYPVAKLHFVEHTASLKNYTRYNELVTGIMTQEDIDKAMQKRAEKEAKELEKKKKKITKK